MFALTATNEMHHISMGILLGVWSVWGVCVWGVGGWGWGLGQTLSMESVSMLHRASIH